MFIGLMLFLFALALYADSCVSGVVLGNYERGTWEAVMGFGCLWLAWQIRL